MFKHMGLFKLFFKIKIGHWTLVINPILQTQEVKSRTWNVQDLTQLGEGRQL